MANRKAAHLKVVERAKADRAEAPPRRKRVILGVSGSIAAYKTPELVRMLTLHGCDVRVVVTASALHFVAKGALETVSGAPVMDDFWTRAYPEGVAGDAGNGVEHIELADWADLMLIAPASADLISKLAHGGADTPLLATALATKAPLLIAPAMNVNMLNHPATVENLALLRARAVQVIEPESGALACGWEGAGRLPSLEEVLWQVERALGDRSLSGERLVITAGPTREAIDPVRFLSNRSSGKMAQALALEAFRRGADVTVVHGPVELTLPRAIRRVAVTSTLEMDSALAKLLSAHAAAPSVVIMAAAVADFRPRRAAPEKLKRKGRPMSLDLIENADLIGEIGKRRRGSTKRPYLVAFALETTSGKEFEGELARKLKAKNVDLIVGNRVDESIGRETNRIVLVGPRGVMARTDVIDKADAARAIFNILTPEVARRVRR